MFLVLMPCFSVEEQFLRRIPALRVVLVRGGFVPRSVLFVSRHIVPVLSPVLFWHEATHLRCAILDQMRRVRREGTV